MVCLRARRVWAWGWAVWMGLVMGDLVWVVGWVWWFVVIWPLGCVFTILLCGWYFGFGGLGGRVLVFGFWVGVLGLG